MLLPTLVVISGPPGTGKTTLAHELARAVGCPAICRDEIKEGMARGYPGFKPEPGDPLTIRTLGVFFEVLRVLVSAGVTVIAEAAFQDKVWLPNLEPLAALAHVKVIQCHADPDVVQERMARHAHARTAHADVQALAEMKADDFKRLAAPYPSIDVDTTVGYDPPIETFLAFVKG